MKKILALGCLLAFAGMMPSSVAHTQQNSPSAEAVPNEILIQYQPGASGADKGDARGWVGATSKRSLRANRGGDMEVVTVTSRAVADAIEVLRLHPAVKLAEPNYIYTVGATANDPRYISGELYGMYSDDTPVVYGPPGTTNEFGSHAEEAWGLGHTGSSSVVVGVIDTGIDLSHPDLAANKWVNPFETVNGVDDDGNGFIDDINGWDCINNDNNPFDDHFHGTHVAGTIGAVGNNGIGVVGVNWTVKLMALKFLGAGGSGNLADAIECTAYATTMKQLHPSVNIVATNNSWGGGGFSTALRNAIIDGANEDILFIAAAGNSNNNNDLFPFYPASYSTLPEAGYDAVISVAAIDNFGFKASFSSYGPTTVDLGASGVGILSTFPGNNYNSISGTSMATPHVAGAAALIASANPLNAALTANQIRNAILNNTTPTPSLTGITVTGGRLNVANAINPPVQLPNLITKKIIVPASAQPGQSITIQTKTKNLGPGSAPPSITHIYFSNNATFDLSDPLLGTRNVPALAPSTASKGPTTVTIPPGTPTGTRYFFVKSDGPGTVAETNEGDNVKKKAITIVP